MLELQIWLHPRHWDWLPKLNGGRQTGIWSLTWLCFALAWMWPSDT
jgi:hypothetical protein